MWDDNKLYLHLSIYVLKERQARTSWQRNRIGRDPPRETRPLPVEAPRPPFVVSAESRSKLRAFRFELPVSHLVSEGLDTGMGVDGGTDAGAGADTILAPTGDENCLGPDDALNKILSPRKSGDRGPHRQSPQTPGMRVPLVEVHSNRKVNFLQDDQDEGPEDKLGWRHRRSPDSSDPPYTPMLMHRRGKKRARSSSPVPSPSEGFADDSEQKDPRSPNSLRRLLQTPQNDPARDLWMKYAGKAANEPLFQFSQLPLTQLVASSPRTAGLRRTMSCGMGWPLSKAKRQKKSPPELTEMVQDELPDDSNDPKVARVSSLLERVQRSLARSGKSIHANHPSSSSPLPRLPDQTGPCLSPWRGKQASLAGGVVGIPSVMRNLPAGQDQPRDSSDRSSEYGDIDLETMDLGILDNLQVALGAEKQQPAVPDIRTGTMLPSTSLGQSSEHFPSALTFTTSEHHPLQQQIVAQQSITTADNGINARPPVDELFDHGFEEDEDELEVHAADLEEIMAKYDHHTQNGRSDSPAGSLSIVVDPGGPNGGQASRTNLMPLLSPRSKGISFLANKPLPPPALANPLPSWLKGQTGVNLKFPQDGYQDGDEDDEYGGVSDRDFEEAAVDAEMSLVSMGCENLIGHTTSMTQRSTNSFKPLHLHSGSKPTSQLRPWSQFGRQLEQRPPIIITSGRMVADKNMNGGRSPLVDRSDRSVNCSKGTSSANHVC